MGTAVDKSGNSPSERATDPHLNASGYTVPIIALVDGITTPVVRVGVAQLYVDVADGDLKVIFGDGTIKTIVVDS